MSAMVMINHSRWIIRHLYHYNAPATHGLVHFNVLLLLAAATPYAAAQARESYSDGPYTNFDPSTTIVIVIMVFAFLFLGFFTIYVRNCVEVTGDGANSRYSAAAAAARSRLSVRGLDPAVIDSFPIFNYAEVKDLKIGKGALECAVCINEFQDNETLRLLPKCDHVFHPECIDAWLSSRSTCPVCRANLTVTPTSGDTAQGTESNHSTDDPNSRSEVSEVQNQNQNQISISVDDDQGRDQQMSDITKQNRERVTKLPRSHSTGHSLVKPGECCERYTLRLPEELRRQIMTRRLKRTTSCIVVFPMEESSRGRQVGWADRVGRSDRWVFTATPPFFSRASSVMSPKVGTEGDVTAVGNSSLFLTSVKAPFDCLANKSEPMSTLLLV